MNDSYIAVLDSGIGGLSVLKELVKSLPEYNYIYLGDNANAPYGNKTVRELKELTAKNIDVLLKFNVKVIVVACNTLSINLLPFIAEYSGLKVFGIFPPVERYMVKGEKVLLLSTVLTAKKFSPSQNLHVLGLKSLVRDLEYNMFNAREINLNFNLSNSVGYYINKKFYYDRIILGCTHYEFIKNEIYDHFCPRKISSGINFTVNNVKNFITHNKSLVNHNKNKVLFVGESAKANEGFWVFGGQKQ